MDTKWEYTQDVCDAWQVHHLCNRFAEVGWEPVAVFAGPAHAEVPHQLSVECTTTYPAVTPTSVLFRRPTP